jgi:hypothetical protein
MAVTDVSILPRLALQQEYCMHSLQGDGVMGFPIVLCIDDRPEQSEIRKAVLQARGFRVET